MKKKKTKKKQKFAVVSDPNLVSGASPDHLFHFIRIIWRFAYPELWLLMSVAVGTLTANKNFAKLLIKRKGSHFIILDFKVVAVAVALRSGFSTAIRGTRFCFFSVNTNALKKE